MDTTTFLFIFAKTLEDVNIIYFVFSEEPNINLETKTGIEILRFLPWFRPLPTMHIQLTSVNGSQFHNGDSP